MAVIDRRPNTHESSPPWGAPPRPRRGRFTVIVLAVVVLAVAVAGGVFFLVNRPSHKVPPVTNTNTKPSTPSATAPVASNPNPTTVQQATAAAVLAVYRAEQDAFQTVVNHNPVDPTDPRLSATMTAGRLSAVRNAFTLLRLQGHYGIGTADLAPVVTAVNGTSASLSDCLFDHSRLVDRTGQTVSGPDTARTLMKVTLQFQGGAWKVSGVDKAGVGCVPGT